MEGPERSHQPSTLQSLQVEQNEKPEPCLHTAPQVDLCGEGSQAVNPNIYLLPTM